MTIVNGPFVVGEFACCLLYQIKNLHETKIIKHTIAISFSFQLTTYFFFAHFVLKSFYSDSLKRIKYNYLSINCFGLILLIFYLWFNFDSRCRKSMKCFRYLLPIHLFDINFDSPLRLRQTWLQMPHYFCGAKPNPCSRNTSPVHPKTPSTSRRWRTQTRSILLSFCDHISQFTCMFLVISLIFPKLLPVYMYISVFLFCLYLVILVFDCIAMFEPFF